ncbi:MAG: hypothetical protein ACMXX8_02060 [Candidatus Woesearchaeota archaeon]
MSRNNTKIALLSIAIAIVSVLFIVYGINTFYKGPDRINYCDNVEFRIDVDSCEDEDPNCFLDPKHETYSTINPEYEKCTENFQKSREKYNMAIFIIMSIIGLFMVIGSFFINIDSVAFGILAGGILSIFVGVIRNWNNVQDWMKFLILGVVLIALVWISYKKMNDNKDTKEKK